jgi:hypothetical protein
MASLHHLPTELLEYILADLSSLDTVNLAKTCKVLHAVALPFAYHSISLEWRAATSFDPRIQSLLHTLVAKSQYVQFIKQLDPRNMVSRLQL